MQDATGRFTAITCQCFSVYETITLDYTSLTSTRNTKAYSMPLKGEKQIQEAGMSHDTSAVSKQTVASKSQPIFQFIEGPTMD